MVPDFEGVGWSRAHLRNTGVSGPRLRVERVNVLHTGTRSLSWRDSGSKKSRRFTHTIMDKPPQRSISSYR